MINLARKIAIGSAQFGLNYGLANKSGKINQKEIKAILDFAYKSSINTIDTAKSYGNSEKHIGNCIRGTEQEWDIITKLSDTKKDYIEQIFDSREKLVVLPKAVLAHSCELFIDPVFQLKLKEAKKKTCCVCRCISLQQK